MDGHGNVPGIIALLMIGGIRPFQTITVICGVPALAIIALMALSFFKDIRKNGWRLSGENSEDKLTTEIETKHPEVLPPEMPAKE
ncbi:choline/carnitine/betaine transporter [Eubacterium callanderi]|uniref:Choline/carnitine/betaine transporter n=1 Tax=Eubacterium callanderi TaxID=53442 RepID=E3GPW2_9FIRM|nr:BCCT family transporter [Eubacterium callanderi]ADO39175.1 choline/carnitine/betaine transporter [Eubacterium callanderi]